MSKRERTLPPGPNPRGDLIKEKQNRQLRDYMRGRSGSGEQSEEAEEYTAADQAEGERSGESAMKMGRTPDQAEGDREKTEEEIRRLEEKR